ncbi:MAG: saccharopine dehydrogenase NADP-binding domain-containing protein [Bacteroidetes bacterium]|nr:saccharopine dehydrogenase NADP-binding domain-containing protein [Bacteroidota bacterium]MBS1972885.1 saccharopine dehydrogenase NADP-binding domain-containing protein [Bacteroidota bacterium]
MKNILLFGAGKSATCLIDYLINESVVNNWQITVVDGSPDLAKSKIGDAQNASAHYINVENTPARRKLVAEADVVISLLPPFLHFLVAQDCVDLGKDLLTASYVDDKIRSLEKKIADKKLLFLCEMGLDPGIDHMSAMDLIHRAKNSGALINSFRSHTGGLVAPESDDNPWHYKISWNPRNVVMAGSAGAVYKEENKIINKTYRSLFENCEEINVKDIGRLAYYPNRDSLSYIPVYDLSSASTFIRTTLRHPSFCRGWEAIVAAGLTNNQAPVNNSLTFKAWSASIKPFITDEIGHQLEFLGLFEDLVVPASAKTSADVLQYLLEKKLAMRSNDKDMIVMVHELEYELENRSYYSRSSLIVTGEDNSRTAMARTVGLPLGIAAKLILQERIKRTGLHIPILPEIYEPVLNELKQHGIRFEEETN